jgi:aspartate aminotransferase
MSKLTASRLDNVSESATLKLNSAVQAMKSAGIDVVNFSTGEPDFSPPEEAKLAVIDAVNKNLSKYTPASGVQELRALIAKKTNSQQPNLVTPWKQENVIVTNGGKQALFNTFQALINSGEKVLIPSPFWISYTEMVKIAGGVPIVLQTSFENNFKLTPDQLKEALSLHKDVKMLILNSPNNPTGAVYSKEEYVELGKVISESKDRIWVVSDEIYDRIILSSTPFCSFLEACPHLQDRTVTVNGLSKSAAMTGWRLGWSVSGLEVAQAIGTLQGQSSSGVSSLTQAAGIAALKIPEDNFNWQIAKYKSRKEMATSILRQAKELKIYEPEGAFYLFLGIGAYLAQGEDSVSFAEKLLKEERVAVVPGTPFGEPEFIRISFATDDRIIEDGCAKILKFLQKSK